MRFISLVSTFSIVLWVATACPVLVEGGSNSGGLGSSATEATEGSATGSTSETSGTVTSAGSSSATEGSGTASESSSSGSTTGGSSGSSSGSTTGSSSSSTTGGSSSTTGPACECEQGVCVDGVCGPAASCLELHEAHGDLGNGVYMIDVDGAGGADAFEVDCDMDEGGWSCVYFNDFQSGSEGWSPGDTTNCDGDEILGGYDQLGKDSPVERTFDLYGIMHSQLRVSGELYAIDSWDDEKMRIELDGTKIWDKKFSVWDFDSKYCGAGIFRDWIEAFAAVADHVAGEANLFFVSDLNEKLTNESFGLDDIRVCIK